MKPATASFAAALLGILALITHAVMTFLTLLGTGLASTPDSPVPHRAETLWGIALWGTPAAALALFLLLVNWTKPAAVAYAVIWLILTGCVVGGWLAYPDDASLPTGQVILQVAIPIASVVLALYGVWRFRGGRANRSLRAVRVWHVHEGEAGVDTNERTRTDDITPA